jgi:hypothetical protein
VSLAAGTRLGPYEIAAPIGAGGMGEVYRARDERLRRDVAIKVLPPSFSSNSEWRARFEQEARAAGALNHPNILSVFDLGQHDGAPYVVSELLEGQSLRARLQEGPLPLRKALDYAMQIAHGLAAAHDKGIVHRDLKPENLFVTRDGRIKILDFGLAKIVAGVDTTESTMPAQTPHTEPGVLLGTVGYMAPEQVRGQPADHRSDIFAFGVVLYEMLAGKRAFGGQSAAEIMSAILRDDPPELTQLQVPPAVEQIVRHCLEKNASERFQSARDLAFHLQALSGLSGVEARLLPTMPPSRRRTAGILAVLAGLVAAGAVGFVAARRTTPGNATPPAAPTIAYRRLTFKRGFVNAARFAPDGQTVLHSASWDGAPVEVQSARLDGLDSRPFGESGTALLAVSSSGELALGVGAKLFLGGVKAATLARAPLSGGAPRELLEDVMAADFTPDGKDLVVVRLVGGKCRIEWPIGRTVFETDGWVNFLRVSPRGDAIAFLEHPARFDDQGQVSLIDREAKHRVLAKGYTSEAGLAWSPSGEEVWFTASEKGEMRTAYAVTLAGARRRLLQLPTGLTLQDVSRDGRVLLTHDDTHAQIRVQMPGELRERELSWRDFTVANDFSADGKLLLMTEQGEGSSQNYSVYVRKTDGSPAVRLGDGMARALSPDGKWVAAYLFPDTHNWQLMPTGAGESKKLPTGNVQDYVVTGWFPDSRRLLVVGHEAGKPLRGFEQTLPDGALRPITPEGVWPVAVTPDGKWIAGYSAGETQLYPMAGGASRKAAGLGRGELPIRLPDDRTAYIATIDGSIARLFRVDLVKGKRELVRTVAPNDAAGVMEIGDVAVSADGKTVLYGFFRYLSDLYLVEGLK